MLAYVDSGNEGTYEDVLARASNLFAPAGMRLVPPTAEIQAEGRFKMRPEKERTISFRITEEEWSAIEKRAATVRESPHQWARSAMLEKLHGNDELTRGERFLFHHIVRAQYLLTYGFQMLADDSLTSEDWRKLCVNAKPKVSEVAESALARLAERSARRP